MTAKRLLNEWRKATLALPLMVTILLALAVAGYAVYHLSTSQFLNQNTLSGRPNVTAFEMQELYDDLLSTSRNHDAEETNVITGKFIARAQTFDLEFRRVVGPDFRDLIRKEGLDEDFNELRDLVARIDAFVKGDPALSPADFTPVLVKARPSIKRLAQTLDQNNIGLTEQWRAKMKRDAIVIMALAALFIMSVVFLVQVEWHRRKNLTVKTRALEISESKLRDLSFYRQQFLANMSHEFRTPLNAIQGFSEAILYQKDTMSQERIFEYVDIVARSARDLASLTEDVLDLSKIDAGKFDIYREDVPFTLLVEDAIVQFQSVAEQRDITIRQSIEADWVVNCDRLAIKRCLTNVLSNALKFSDQGGAIYVDAYIRDKRMLVVEVRDVGCGIPERDLQSIWMVYARSSLTRKCDREGAGLGLAMVKALMDAHSGFVELQSREGVGTSVRMCIPVSAVVSTNRREVASLAQPVIAIERNRKVG